MCKLFCGCGATFVIIVVTMVASGGHGHHNNKETANSMKEDRASLAGVGSRDSSHLFLALAMGVTTM